MSNFQASAKLDEIQIRLTTTDLPATSSLLAKLHLDIASSLEEAIMVPIAQGRELLENMGADEHGAEVN